ncbi:MAG: type II toxin-antitoxin system Phd/YefM family antitoxin [Acidobacteria bacterium]|nr:MAG: type II toxin-antitoxin system Phd/YefM family antitoxin [Acidobacteriota bacterium]
MVTTMKPVKIKKVSVAEGKKAFTQLLREAEQDRVTILIFRRGELAGALLPPEEYERLERLQAYFEALRLSGQLADLPVNAAKLAHEARRELEKRT